MASHYDCCVCAEQVADRLGKFMDLVSKPAPFCTGIIRFINGRFTNIRYNEAFY
jgi:hypothetical protein